MTEQQIMDGNKIIFNFMHKPLSKDNSLEQNYFRLIHEKDNFKNTPYYKLWDGWLMPVVEKIESLGFKTSIENSYCSIDGDDIYFESKGFNLPKISATMEAVIEFIKWYNENKPA